MILEHTAIFKINVFERPPDAEFIKMRPKKYQSYKWIPQSATQEVIILIEFYNEEDKDNYIQNLPAQFKEFLTNILTQEDLDNWS